MKPFEPAFYTEAQNDAVRRKLLRAGVAPENVEQQIAYRKARRTFRNDAYQVDVSDMAAPEGWPPMLELSIKRIDRRPIFDWRELQHIKNAIVGPENEGVQLFPAESRLVDTANQYWLFVYADPTVRLPFGFKERLVDGTGRDGAKQRPFNTQPGVSA